MTSINLLLVVMFFNLVVMLMVLSWTHLWMSLKCWQQNWTQWFSSSHRGNAASLFFLSISQITYKPLTILSCAAVISLLFLKLITSRNKIASWFLILDVTFHVAPQKPWLICWVCVSSLCSPWPHQNPSILAFYSFP